MKSFWITFYSYKGGVGRSLALANMAALLAERGRRVVLIDFDLEAPGLDSFAEFQSCSSQPGVVEYVTKFIATQKAPGIEPYVHTCKHLEQLRGQVWVMPAGRKDESYSQQRVAIDWVNLYQTGLGVPFIENLKASIQEAFRPDYVLVDSRTGLSDIGGICTLQIPDLVILLFGLNEQNIRGISSVAQLIRESPGIRTPQILPVATPVPQLSKDDSGLLRDRLENAKKLLKMEITNQISYFPQAALAEKLFVLQDDLLPSSSIEFEYKHLLDQCIAFNRNGLDFLVQKAKEFCTSLDKSKAFQIADILQEEHIERAEALFWIARIQRTFGNSKEAKINAQRALKLDPIYTEALELLRELHKSSPRSMLTVLNDLLLDADHIEDSELRDHYHERGNLAMQLNDYELAFQSYKAGVSITANDDLHFNQLINSFNMAEAERRSTKSNNVAAWTKVVDIFNKYFTTGSQHSQETRANQYQAMHIAYACVGDLERARKSLVQANILAESLSVVDQVFSVKTYTYINVDQFAKHNVEMLQALDQGKLWDGMNLNNKRVSNAALRKRNTVSRRRKKP
ncbi:MAG: AAA family ATPase [Methylacidiphilales bacterium]|nr:AAA family ATPase [Candidatus Methylacidiphilales bacterium]